MCRSSEGAHLFLLEHSHSTKSSLRWRTVPCVSATRKCTWYRMVPHNRVDTCIIRRASASMRKCPDLGDIHGDCEESYSSVQTAVDGCSKRTQLSALFKTRLIFADCSLRNHLHREHGKTFPCVCSLVWICAVPYSSVWWHMQLYGTACCLRHN